MEGAKVKAREAVNKALDFAWLVVAILLLPLAILSAAILYVTEWRDK